MPPPRQARAALCALLAALLLAALPPRARAADAVVGTGSPASCTEAALDTALAAAAGSGGGTITFSCGAAPHTILLSAQKSINADIALSGEGRITLSGNNATALFQVFSGYSFALSGVSLARGYGPYGAIENFGRLSITGGELANNTATDSGGAILNHGELRLADVVFASNSAAKLGGGISSDGGIALIERARFSGNTAADGGAGLALAAGASATLSDSTFAGNRATATFAEGAGIQSSGALTVTASLFELNNASRGGGLAVLGGDARVLSSTIARNVAAYGGGIRQSGGTLVVSRTTFSGNGYSANGVRVTTGGGGLSWTEGVSSASLSDVTISGNWASYGGGFDNTSGTVALTNVTISGNDAVGGGGFDQGGGVITLVNVTISGNKAGFFAGGASSRGGTLTLRNTVLADNINSDPNKPKDFNCNKAIAGASFSLSSDFTCGFGAGRDNVDARLGPLQDNGGGLLTHLPARGSPLIDAGAGAGCPATDERGVARPQGQACDIGAVEARADDFASRVYLPLVWR